MQCVERVVVWRVFEYGLCMFDARGDFVFDVRVCDCGVFGVCVLFVFWLVDEFEHWFVAESCGDVGGQFV